MNTKLFYSMCFAMAHDIFLTVASKEEGMRFDAFVAARLRFGHRAAKRLILNGFALVNDKSRLPHFKLAAGMEVCIHRVFYDVMVHPDVNVVGESESYIVFCKPGGLHTTRITGSSEPSLEDCLPEPHGSLILLSRLDAATSGLVAAARSTEYADGYRRQEMEGRVRKTYLAMVRGTVSTQLHLKNELDTDSRSKTRVLPAYSEDSSRHTLVTPLTFPVPMGNASLVAVHIQRGARHQIRAHLAAAGHPIVGDPLYGADANEGPLYLHHTRLALPELTFFCPPPWLPDFLQEFL